MVTRVDPVRVQQLAAIIQANFEGEAKKRPALRVVNGDSCLDEKAMTASWESFKTESDTLALPDVDTSPRGIQTRAIKRIMHAYPWGVDAVRFFLDTKGHAYLSDLNETQLDDLHDRMNGYVDAAMTGCDSIDAPPAM